MKIQLNLKDTNIGFLLCLELPGTENEELRDALYQKLFKHGEYVKLEIDTETLEAVVVPNV